MSSAGVASPSASGRAVGPVAAALHAGPTVAWREIIMQKVRLSPYYDGWFAHRDGLSLVSNPYDILRQSYSAEQWSQGWADRRLAVNVGSSLEFDDNLAPREWG